MLGAVLAVLGFAPTLSVIGAQLGDLPSRPAERTIARGEALLAPAVTRQLIGHFAVRLRPAAPPKDLADRLSPRELQVLEHIAMGLSNAEIAESLFITPETVKTYVSRILTKLDLRDRVQAVVLAYRLGLVTGP